MVTSTTNIKGMIGEMFSVKVVNSDWLKECLILEKHIDEEEY